MTNEPDSRISGRGTIALPALQVSGRMRVRADYSVAHLRGAAVLAAECRPLEEKHSWPPTNEVLFRHSANASGSVILAVSALEAFANELHIASESGLRSSMPEVSEASLSIFRQWEEVERKSVVQKLQWILERTNRPPFSTGMAPLQAIGDLVAVRNALVHYRTEWGDDAKTSERLEARLRGNFAENRLSTSGQVFFPYRCLGYGCASWAVRSVIDFVRTYCDALGITYRFEKFEPGILAYLEAEEGDTAHGV